MWKCLCLCVFVSDRFAGACPFTNCKDLVKLFIYEISLQTTPAWIHIHIMAHVCAKSVCFLLCKKPRRRLCSRWTESDRGKERWSELLVKAAGQWGGQKLIREAVSFTSPQLDQLCVRGQRIGWLWKSLKGVFVCLHACVCVRLCVYLPARGIALPPLSSSIWLAHPNKPHANYHLWRAWESHFLRTSVNWMTIYKWHLRRADVLKPSGLNNGGLVIIVLDASCSDEEREGGEEERWETKKWEKLRWSRENI